MNMLTSSKQSRTKKNRIIIYVWSVLQNIWLFYYYYQPQVPQFSTMSWSDSQKTDTWKNLKTSSSFESRLMSRHISTLCLWGIFWILFCFPYFALQRPANMIGMVFFFPLIFKFFFFIFLLLVKRMFLFCSKVKKKKKKVSLTLHTRCIVNTQISCSFHHTIDL